MLLNTVETKGWIHMETHGDHHSKKKKGQIPTRQSTSTEMLIKVIFITATTSK